jgi:hypothetical protein
MERQFDIPVARDRRSVKAREVELALEIPLSSLGAIERGRITIDEAMYNKIHAAIDEIARGRETATCDETLASASI